MKVILALLFCLCLTACGQNSTYLYRNSGITHKEICIEGKKFLQTTKTYRYVTIQPIYGKGKIVKKCKDNYVKN